MATTNTSGGPSSTARRSALGDVLAAALSGTDPALVTLQREIAGLDPGIPIALLPVRLETRFFTVGTKTELRIRIYPDDVHAAAPKLSAVLPKRWIAMAMLGDEIVAKAVSEPVSESLTTRDPDGRVDFGKSAATQWLVDFDEAKAKGMGIVLPLSGAAAKGLDHLLVLGVRGGTGAAEAGAATIAQIVAPDAEGNARASLPALGTPTNNSEDALAGTQPAPGATEAAGALYRSSWYDLNDGDLLAFAFGTPSKTFATLDGAGRVEQRWRRAMNNALWPVTLRRLFTEILVAAGDRDAFKRCDELGKHFANYVRASGPLPLLQIGAQPYGVLPITPLTKISSPNSTSDLVSNAVLSLWSTWQDAAARVPCVDVDASDSAADPAVAESPLGAILAMQPAPLRFMARTAAEHAATLLDSFLGGTNKRPPSSAELATWSPTAQVALRVATSSATTLDEQRKAMSTLVSAPTVPANWRSVFATRSSYLEQYNDLFNPLVTAGFPRESIPPLLEKSRDGLVGTLRAYEDTPTSWSDDNLVDRGDPALLATTAAAIDKAVAAMTSPILGDPPSSASLLRHLIHRLPTVATPETSKTVTEALGKLATRTPAELRQWMTETLGLAGPRLDAWATSVATSNLAVQRGNQKTGIYLGGFGYVRDLKPRASGPGIGFLHAPSLDHAVAAAVLRSGHLVYDDASAGATFAVNLDSHRVRLARWLYDGVRQGQPLSVLLGQRFERALHDEQQDHLIDGVRRAVLMAKGSSAAPSETVDGLVLARGIQGGEDLSDAERNVPGKLPKEFLDYLGASQKTVGGNRLVTFDDTKGAYLKTVGVLLDALDAAADAGLFESVFSLVQGNTARAGATLEAIDQGDAPPPDLRSLESPRGGTTVEHRLVLRLGQPTATPASLSAAADPRLEALARRLLGPRERVRYDVVWRLPNGEPHATVERRTLKDLGLDALELLRRVETPAISANSDLRRRLLTGLRAPVPGAIPELDVAASSGIQSNEITLEEHLVVANAVRGVLTGGRALKPEDLGTTEVGTAEALKLRLLDIATLLDGPFRERPAIGALEQLSAQDLADLASILDQCEALGVRTDPHDDAASTREAAIEVRERLERLAARARAATGDLMTLRAAIQELCGWSLPVTTPIAQPPGVDPGATALQVGAWLSGVARVRAPTAALERALRLTEAVAAAPLLRLSARQTWSSAASVQAVAEPKGWVATTAPPAGRAYASTVTATAPDSATDGPVWGLLVDTWSERVPSDEQVTGLAVHWDAPSSRAPQAILLATLERGKTWSASALGLAVAQTMELARFRMVALEHLGSGDGVPGLLQFLPAITLDGRVFPGGKPLGWGLRYLVKN